MAVPGGFGSGEPASLLTRLLIIKESCPILVSISLHYPCSSIDGINKGHQAHMVSLGTLSVIEFSGQDAGQFLHNQLSADIAAIPAGGTGFACCCNPAGRVLGLLLVTVQEGAIFAICASDLAATLQQWLNRFVIRADVKIAVRSDLLVAAHAQDQTHDQAFLLNTDTGLSYSIIPATDHRADPQTDLLVAWHIDELKAGIVWLDSASSAQFLPQMLGFESIGALNFNKGCYPGQEIIARTRYLGNLKRRPMLLHAGNSPVVDVMEKIGVRSGEANYSAVVVDRAPGPEQDQYLFTVVRAGQDVTAEKITIREQVYDSI